MRSRIRKPARHKAILAALTTDPTQRVGTLAKVLGVSSETIRRDLAELNEAGQINRTYGGAVRADQFEPALDERMKLFNEERRLIGQAALRFLEPFDTIMLGAGASLMFLARALVARQTPLTVITPAYALLRELGQNPLIDVHVLPGAYAADEGIGLGAETLESIDRYFAPMAVLGVSGIDEHGASEANVDVAPVYRAMIQRSEHTVFLADHSKFGKRALSNIARWSDAVSIITDTAPVSGLRSVLDVAGTGVTLAK